MFEPIGDVTVIMTEDLPESRLTLTSQPLIVPTVLTCDAYNRVLASRKGRKVFLSQTLITEPCSYILLQEIALAITSMCRFGKVDKVLRIRLNGCPSRGFWESTRKPREGEDAAVLDPRDGPEPPLKPIGYSYNVTDFPPGQSKIPEANCELLQASSKPVNSARTALSYPSTEYPTATLLRKTRGNETRPHSLPNSCVMINFTPMGLALLTLRGRRAGTYETAKKKRR